MKRSSPRKLARSFVMLWDKYPTRILIDAFAQEITESHMQRDIDIIMAEIGREFLKQKGHVTAEVVTARPSQPGLFDKIKQLIKQETKATSVDLHHRLDPRLIGGAKVTTPEFTLDMSIKSALEHLEI